MLLGKRPRPPVMRRTRSMSGGLATDMQTTDEHNQTNNLEPHHEEQQQSVMSNHNPLPLLPQPHDDDQHALVTMETEESHRESTVMYHHDQGRIQTSHTSVAKRERNHDEGLVENTVMMFPSYATTITNNSSTIINHNIPLSVSAPVIHSTPHFLRICGLCNCPLAPGRDIYMYRGDTAFCSLECREEQMKQDKRIEKWKMTASNKEEHRVAPPCTATAKASTAACT